MTAPPAAAARWVCCQLGAREHYAVPRALHRRGSLARLITDAWVPPGSMVDALPGQQARRLSERYHPDLADAAVTSFTASLVARELEWRMKGHSGWPLFIERNQWFQRQAASALGDSSGLQEQIVFAHSYAALEIFRRARAAGARCVLGQIDPGGAHFEIVRDAALAAPEDGPPPASPPPEYLGRWHEECGLADQIVVNSEWSRSCLERAGIPAAKLRIVPLAYEPESRDMTPRNYPDAFSVSRPLRILFVGQVSVAKGAAAIASIKLRVPHGGLAELHPADLATIIDQLAPKDRAGVLASLDDEAAADAIEEMEPDTQVEVLEDLAPERAADILEEMSPDDAADLVADLSDEARAEILALMERDEAEEVRELLGYPEDTAGGIMTTEFVTIAAALTAAQAIDRLRELEPDAETIYYVYVTDDDGRLVGVLSLRDLIVAAPAALIGDVMIKEPVAVGVLADQEEVAQVVAHYNLLAVPVIDEEGRLAGIVTVDDAIDTILPTAWKKRLPRLFARS